MPSYTWVEDGQSRSATIYRLGKRSQNTYKKSWKIFGTSDDRAVHDDVNATLWTFYMYWEYPGQPLNKLQADSYSLDYIGDEAWQLTVSYVSAGADDDQKPDPLRRSRSFDTSGATVHITQSVDGTERRYPTNVAPDMKGAIGVDGDNVNGVDIVVPHLQWTESYDVAAQYVTSEYINVLADITGSVNNSNFRLFRHGEVLFLGATGSQDWDEERGNSPWTLSYKFVAAKNRAADSALTIGDIANIEKNGHEYLWIRYESGVANDTLLKRPRHVYVDKVYEEKDFSLLGIGLD